MINDKWSIKKQREKFSIVHLAFSIAEPFARFAQLKYMQKRKTSEVVSAALIRFHPTDARVWVRDALAKRLAHYNIPLDNFFYGS